MGSSDFSSLDTARERFFGWFPREKGPAVFLVLNVIYFLSAWFLWPYLPQFLLFGWIPSPYVWYIGLFTPINMILWGVYFTKYWTALKDSEE